MSEEWKQRRPCDPKEIAAQLHALGIEGGGVLVVHTSYRAARPVEGGPAGLVDGLRLALGSRGTLVMPSFTGNDDAAFDPATTAADPELGVVADIFWREAGVCRSDHPFAFAAQGPQAEAITADPLPLPPHGAASPIGRVHELDGQVLLIGAGQDANTTLHLAELMADVPYRRKKYCTVVRDGRPQRLDYLENDHCCQRFALADDWLRARGLMAEGAVGYAQARLMRSRDIVEVVRERLLETPLRFLHAQGDGCAECGDARRSLSA